MSTYVPNVSDASRKSGYRLVGDVDYTSVADVAGWLTPVPGGVGPMTVAMLMSNTLRCAKKQLKVCMNSCGCRKIHRCWLLGAPWY